MKRLNLPRVLIAMARSVPVEIVPPSALLRPLAEYEALVGGSW
jgi:hypothetical protein